MLKNITIQHENFGLLLSENFVNFTQFKLFLKLINGCFETKKDLLFFNGNDIFFHIPYKILTDCVISTKEISETESNITLTSKIQSLTK